MPVLLVIGFLTALLLAPAVEAQPLSSPVAVELVRVDAEIRLLREQRPGIAGPLSLTVVGASLLAVGTLPVLFIGGSGDARDIAGAVAVFQVPALIVLPAV